jgi:hypothetical protein
MADLQDLLRHPAVWRAGAASPAPGVETGWAALDAVLPGGWPRGALTELITDYRGGALQVVLPVLGRLTRRGEWIAFVAPPHVPYAPGLMQAGLELERLLVVRAEEGRPAAWAAEQGLRAGSLAALCWWPDWGGHRRLADRDLRRLQLAAERGDCLGFLFRAPVAAREGSPAALRLAVAYRPDGMALTVFKARGVRPGRRIVLPDDTRPDHRTR